MHNGRGIFQFSKQSDQNKHCFTFFFILPSWKIVIFSGSSFYMAEGHFFHLVYHLPIGFKYTFHLVVTFVLFRSYFVLIGLKHIFQSAPSKSPYPSLQNPFPKRPKMNFGRSFFFRAPVRFVLSLSFEASWSPFGALSERICLMFFLF